jgi:hypothetical protein
LPLIACARAVVELVASKAAITASVNNTNLLRVIDVCGSSRVLIQKAPVDRVGTT